MNRSLVCVRTSLFVKAFALMVLCLVLLQPWMLASAQAAATPGQTQHHEGPSLNSPASRDQRRLVTLAEEVRHQLVMLPYYSVFDWLEANVSASGEVTLIGDVVKP